MRGTQDGEVLIVQNSKMLRGRYAPLKEAEGTERGEGRWGELIIVGEAFATPPPASESRKLGIYELELTVRRGKPAR